MNPLTKRQRNFLETELLPYTQSLDYQFSPSTIQRILRLGVYGTGDGNHLNSIAEEWREWKPRLDKITNNKAKPLGDDRKHYYQTCLIPLAHSIQWRNRDIETLIQGVVDRGEYTEKQSFVTARLSEKLLNTPKQYKPLTNSQTHFIKTELIPYSKTIKTYDKDLDFDRLLGLILMQNKYDTIDKTLIDYLTDKLKEANQ